MANSSSQIKKFKNVTRNDNVVVSDDENLSLVKTVNNTPANENGDIQLSHLVSDQYGDVYKQIPASDDGNLVFNVIKNDTFFKYVPLLGNIAYGNGVYVMVSYYGVGTYSYDLEKWYYSDRPFDTVGGGGGGGYNVVFNEKLGMFCSISGNRKVYVSYDGIHWLDSGFDSIVGSDAGNNRALGYGNGVFLIGTWETGNDDGGIWISKDGFNWVHSLDKEKTIPLVETLPGVAQGSQTGDARIFAITYFKGTYYVAGDYGCYASKDLENWYMPEQLAQLQNSIHCWWTVTTNGKFLVGSIADFGCVWSEDGETWQMLHRQESDSINYDWYMSPCSGDDQDIYLVQSHNDYNKLNIVYGFDHKSKMFDLSSLGVVQVIDSAYVNGRMILTCYMNDNTAALYEVKQTNHTRLVKLNTLFDQRSNNVARTIRRTLSSYAFLSENSSTIDSLIEKINIIMDKFGSISKPVFYQCMYFGNSVELNKFVKNNQSLVTMSSTLHNESAEDEGFFVVNGDSSSKMTIVGKEETWAILVPTVDILTDSNIVFRTRLGIIDGDLIEIQLNTQPSIEIISNQQNEFNIYKITGR